MGNQMFYQHCARGWCCLAALESSLRLCKWHHEQCLA